MALQRFIDQSRAVAQGSSPATPEPLAVAPPDDENLVAAVEAASRDCRPGQPCRNITATLQRAGFAFPSDLAGISEGELVEFVPTLSDLPVQFIRALLEHARNHTVRETRAACKIGTPVSNRPNESSTSVSTQSNGAYTDGNRGSQQAACLAALALLCKARGSQAVPEPHILAEAILTLARAESFPGAVAEERPRTEIKRARLAAERDEELACHSVWV